MGQQGKVHFKGILNSRGRTEGREATHTSSTSNTLLIAAKLLMRFDDNISLSYLNLGPKAVFGFWMGLILSCSVWCCVERVNPSGPFQLLKYTWKWLYWEFSFSYLSLIHTHYCRKEKLSTDTNSVWKKEVEAWVSGRPYSSEWTNVINGACWARLAWDWSSCNVCHQAINSLDRASQKLQKVRGPGFGP